MFSNPNISIICFSFDEFSAVRCSTLIDVKKSEMIRIESMLSSLFNPRDFFLNYAQDTKDQLLNSLPRFNYRTLLIPILFPDLTFIQEATLITN